MPEFGIGGGVKVRVTTADDIPAIYALFREVESDVPITADTFAAWWRWLYADNPTGKSFGLGAFAPEGACVGHVGVTAFAFNIDGARKTAGFPCQLMVSTGQRKTLIYPTLVRRLLKDYPKSGIDFCYAPITRPRVLEANLALGFRRCWRMPVLARPYRTAALMREIAGGAGRFATPLAPLADLVLRAPVGLGGGGITTREVSAFPESFEAWLGARAAETPLAAVRDVSALRWRFNAPAWRDYRIFLAERDGAPAGYIVLRRMPMRAFDTLALVDFAWDQERPEGGRALLAAVHRLALAERVDMTTAVAPPGSAAARLLAGAGFLQTPESFTLVIHGAPPDLDARPSTDWRLTWFDHDFV